MDTTRGIIDSILTKNRFSDIINPEMELCGDLGFDSLSLVELIVFLEEKFGIEINESDLDPNNIKTVGQIYILVEKYLEV